MLEINPCATCNINVNMERLRKSSPNPLLGGRRICRTGTSYIRNVEITTPGNFRIKIQLCTTYDIKSFHFDQHERRKTKTSTLLGWCWRHFLFLACTNIWVPGNEFVYAFVTRIRVRAESVAVLHSTRKHVRSYNLYTTHLTRSDPNKSHRVLNIVIPLSLC